MQAQDLSRSTDTLTMKCGTGIIAAVTILAAWLPTAAALELFGVELESGRRDQLRTAAKEAGLELIREGGEDNWFDVYDSAAVIPGSRRFYLGFVKQDQRFAFAEYEFNGLQTKRLLDHLVAKYGSPEKLGGRYLSDLGYRWQRDGIVIELSSDWQNYKTRISYIDPTNMVNLRAEQAQFESQSATGISLF